MIGFRLGYEPASVDQSVDLHDISNYFVTAHTFHKSQDSANVILDLVLTIQGQTTGELDAKIQLVNEMVVSASQAGPGYYVGKPLLLWVKLGSEGQWSLWTVKSGVVAPMDIGSGRGTVYQTHVRLTVLPTSIGDQLFVSDLVVNGSQLIYVARVPGTHPAATKLSLANLPASLAKLYVGVRGHKNLFPGLFDGHYPGTGSVALSGEWQNVGSVASHRKPFDTGIFDIFLDIADFTPFFSGVTDLVLATGQGGLPGGAYEYYQVGYDRFGNLGPLSNLVSVLFDSSPLVFSTDLSSLPGERYALGGICPQPFAYGIDDLSYPLVGAGGCDFRVASDGWVLSEAVTEPLLVPGDPYHGTVGPTNKRPPKPGELGYAESYIKVALAASLSSRRSVRVTLDFKAIVLGGLGSPAFFPLLGRAGVCVDAFGWRLYLGESENIVKDWQDDKVIFAPLSTAPAVGANVFGLSFDWSLGFLNAELRLGGELVARLVSVTIPAVTDPTLGVILTNELPEYKTTRVDDQNPANWSFTKVSIQSVSDSAASTASGSSSGGFSASESSSSGASFGTGSGFDNGTSGTASEDVGSSGASSASKATATAEAGGGGSTDNENSTVVQFFYKDIPVTSQGADSLQETDVFTGDTSNHSVDSAGNHIAMVGPLTDFPQLSYGELVDVPFAGYFPVLGTPQFGTTENEFNWYRIVAPRDTSFTDAASAPTVIGASDSQSSPASSGTSKSASNGSATGGGTSDGSGLSNGSSSSGSSSTSESSQGAHSTSSGSSSGSAAGSSTSTSFSLTLNGAAKYDIPLPGISRSVYFVSQVTTTTRTSSSEASNSTSTGEEQASSLSGSSSRSENTTTNGSEDHSTSASNSASSTTNSAGGSGGSNGTSASTSMATDENTSTIIGDFFFFNEEKFEVGGSKITKKTEVNRITDFYTALGIPEPPPEPESTNASIPRITDHIAYFFGVPTPEPDIISTVELFAASTSVGLPSTTSGTQDSTATAAASANQNNSSTNTTGSAGVSASLSSNKSTGNGGSVGSNKADSGSESDSSDKSSSGSESESQSSGDSVSTSVSYEDVYKLVPRLETIVPDMPAAPMAFVDVTVSNLQVYDGPLPVTGSRVFLDWTLDTGLQTQHIFRRNTSLVNSAWQYMEIDANDTSFVDDGQSGWVTAELPDFTTVAGPAQLKLALDGIIDTRPAITGVGYGRRQYVVFPGVNLSPAPGLESRDTEPVWSFDVLAKAGSSFFGPQLTLNDCFILPHEQSQLRATGAAENWEIETNRYDASGASSGLDVVGSFRLSPGGNAITFLGEDENGVPLSMEQVKVSLAITPESEWMQSLE